MRRFFFVPALIAGLGALVLLGLSLFSFVWTSVDGSKRVGLAQGCINLWRGQQGDFPGSAGLKVYGWSGDALMWRPEVDPECKVWVAAAAPSKPSASVPVRRIVGVSIMLPVLYPLLLAAVVGGITFVPWRRHRRLRRGECPKCRYDQRGLTTPRCPECGTILRKLFARLFRRRAAAQA